MNVSIVPNRDAVLCVGVVLWIVDGSELQQYNEVRCERNLTHKVHNFNPLKSNTCVSPAEKIVPILP